MVRPQDLDAEERQQLLDGTVDRGELVASLDKVGIAGRRRAGRRPVEEGRDHAERRHLEDTQRALVEGWTSRRTSCRSCPAASTWPASTSWPRRSTAGAGMNARDRLDPPAAGPAPGSARSSPPTTRHRCSTSTHCSTTAAAGSSCAAAPAASARPPPRPRSRCGRPSAAARSWCSPSTRPAGWRSRWGSRRWTTPRGRCPGSAANGERRLASTR